MSGNRDIHNDPNHNKAGFHVHPENINRTGQNRKVSIKRELAKLLDGDGLITYSGSQIKEIGEKDGVQFVKIKVPTQEALAAKIISIAMGSNKQTNTLRAAIQLLEQFDGKPAQSIETKFVDTKPEIIVMDQKTKDAINDLM